MKILMMYCNTFAFVPAIKNLEEAPEAGQGKTYQNVLVAFIQAEEKDEDDPKGTEDKLLNVVKWGARKNESRHVILHSFAHLSESKASPAFTQELFNRSQQRMLKADWQCDQTPFGYFLDLQLDAPGVSQARIFKAF
ncbi:MAG: threonyl-tRNA synthetase editing domain-containing protein [Bacteroidetes bacterium]|nr:threonyl-tRNA synthetase editing domain-containing protein [Bacteroidota bacterium]MBU1577921.1 threonyl-tRNA synthetase editing domain-containing protein [Bacteroidota bacterium]MBU2466179.1 threonyl-tRNA synthetase editing domain-containing protein [Bacteroidota bacterium]MBU2558584.1 threonyl-tRNA synthetase editing domain-containing protein [Bacteroidota bacterium]